MPFADEMIGEETAHRLAKIIDAETGGSHMARRRRTGPLMAPLPLRQRVDVLSDELLSSFDGDYFALAHAVRNARANEDFTGWMIWPVTESLAAAAVAENDSAAFDDALDALAELTGLLTSEYAIRRLLRHDVDRVLSRTLKWTSSDDEHVRRLASEGTRPYLPWAVRVQALTSTRGLTMPILDSLYCDPTEYVRRSVANHLNDLSRDDSGLVVDTARRWAANADSNTAWVLRHGMRTLTKRGDHGALELQGYAHPDGTLEVDGPHVDRDTVAIGDRVHMHARVHNTGTSPARIMVDYVVHHLKANGTQSPKVFKLKTASLAPSETLEFRWKHSFREVNARRYYPGAHAISLQINGHAFGRAEFDLEGRTDL